MKIRLQQNRILSSTTMSAVADSIIESVQSQPDPLDQFASDPEKIEAAQALGRAGSGVVPLMDIEDATE